MLSFIELCLVSLRRGVFLLVQRMIIRDHEILRNFVIVFPGPEKTAVGKGLGPKVTQKVERIKNLTNDVIYIIIYKVAHQLEHE